MRRVVLLGLILGSLAFASAEAQVDNSHSAAMADDMQARLDAPPDPSLPPVETLTCEQMQAEMMVAGQQMQAQMDPSLAGNITSFQQDMQDRQRGAMAGAVGTGLMCSVPGLGMACSAVMQAQMANQMRQAQADQSRMDTIMGQVNDSTQGIDLARMQALNDRWESQHCQMPQEPAPAPQ